MYLAKILRMAVLIIVLPYSSHASGPGTTAANFLKIGIGAKATAMGKAFTALADDGTSIYWNPAGLAQLEEREISLMYNRYLMEINQGYMSFALPLHQGTIGLATNYVNMGDMEGRDEEGNPTGDFSASDFQLSLAYARSFSSQVMFGISTGLLQDAIKGERETAWFSNIGLLMRTTESLSVGVVCQNIGSKVGEDPLPLTLRGGVVARFESFDLELDVVKPKDNDLYFCAGTQYRVKQISAVRCGYGTGRDESTGSGFNVGFGLVISDFNIDYAYVPWGDLDNSQKLSLGIRF